MLLEDICCFPRWSIESNFEPEALEEDGLQAHIEQQQEMASYVGDMVIGIVWSRFQWGADYMFGFPRRCVLLASDHRLVISAELKRHWELVQSMSASDSTSWQNKAKTSHLMMPSAKQFVYALQSRAWVPDDTITDLTRNRFRRAESTKMIEEAHRAQNTFVRNNPIHRVSHNAAMHALFTKELLPQHKFDCDLTCGQRAGDDQVLQDSVFDPKDEHAWPPLRTLPGWSSTPNMAYHICKQHQQFHRICSVCNAHREHGPHR